MIILEERLTDKVKHRKQITIEVIIHDSTIEKVVETDLEMTVNNLIKHQIKNDEKEPGYATTRLFWEKILKEIPKVKLDNRFKIGDYHFFNKLYLKIRNPDRFKKQIIELCYID